MSLIFLVSAGLRQDSDYATAYIVFAGKGTDFHTLDSIAGQISEKTGIPYRNDLVFDSVRGMIVPDTSSDEIYAGKYFPRRDLHEERISIENADYYAKGSYSESSLRMTIITGIYSRKMEAGANLEKVRKVVPGAWMKEMKLYQGCMH